jgi:hypothetical protein
MHVGKLYPTAFRRDFPTGQIFPNLWPDRIFFDFFQPTLMPGSRWPWIDQTVSEHGEPSPSGQFLVYQWILDDGLFTGTTTFSIGYGVDEHDQRYIFQFEDTGFPGILILEMQGYGLDPNPDYWNFNLVMPLGLITITQSGSFAGVLFADPTIIRMSYADYFYNPHGWWD